MGFLAAIGSAIGSFISTTVGKLGSAVAAGVKYLSTVAGPVLSKVADVISTISSILDISKVNDRPEDLGVKATMADRKMEDFDSYKDYINYLSNDVELTDEMKDKLKDEKFKAECTCIGAAIQWHGIDEKMEFNMGVPDATRLVEAGVNTVEAFKTISDTFKENNVEPRINDAIEYKLPIDEKVEVIDTLKEGVDKIDNSKEIWDKLDKMLEDI